MENNNKWTHVQETGKKTRWNNGPKSLGIKFSLTKMKLELELELQLGVVVVAEVEQDVCSAQGYERA